MRKQRNIYLMGAWITLSKSYRSSAKRISDLNEALRRAKMPSERAIIMELFKRNLEINPEAYGDG